MPTTTSAEQSLINDSEFIEELRQFSAADQEPPALVSANLSAPEPRGIPLITAALVLVTCLTAGAVTAACLFQDQLTHITARPSATR
jgi:hypothetical protein